ncbi:hypothetical protein VFC49_08315 [Thermococcus sp. SY098]|uniref:hypothetical protein n=1 Tax=Thermococcus sp. SY098 TaxID=3111325 RepID=UPI002D796F06|nr:hypothetical protein [Thermococcus sp. SY098]WRS52060.1 hypothetical protein VFC49_08315 [Thermococcus sp. SY098]
MWFDESATAGAVIGVNSPSGRTFAPHETGVITTLSLDLDKIAHALGLDDPRDLNPYTERWDCHDGSCVYLRERFDRQHYITVEVQAVNDAKDYLKTIQITRTITTRYSGSKYWKTDAGVGIATGVGALAATVALPTYLGVKSTASTTPWIIVQIEEKARTLSTMSLAEPAKDVLREILNILWGGHDE